MVAHPLAVDRHQIIVRDTEFLDLRDASDFLHVRSITSSPKDHADSCPRVRIMRCDKGASGIVNQCGEFDGDVVFREGGGEQRSGIVSLNICVPEAFGPSDENAVVYAFLMAWI